MSAVLPPELSAHLESLVPARPAEMVAMEAWAAEHDFPIIGAAAGHFCYLVARMIGARRVYELGSGYGYSTAWFARAVRENGGGTVHHVVWDEALSLRARGHLERLGLSDLVDYEVEEAVAAPKVPSI
jgi:caffeoyl-CoA O-methyltransferase